MTVAATGSRVEHVAGTPAAPLRPFVLGYSGFREWSPGPVRRRELPFGGVAVILSLEAGWRLGAGVGDAVPLTAFGSFVGGLIDRPVLAEHAGYAHALQLDLTPLGSRALFGVPGRELADRVVAFDDVLGREGARLVHRLADLDGWPARFAALEAFLTRRLLAAPAPSPDVAWAWRRLVASGGAVRVGTLVEELGCSARHLAARFGEEVGMTPKAYARLLRFERAVRRLRDGEEELGRIAAACGFADQSHFTRELRAFAGTTPTALMAERAAAGFVL